MASHNELGNRGEAIACTHLEKNGYQILETNWRYDRAELDIVAEKGGYLVVIEVKTRSTDFFGNPIEFVSEQKQKLMIKAAEAYLDAHELNLEVRFDIIGIVIDPAFPLQSKLRHIEDAFCAFG